MNTLPSHCTSEGAVNATFFVTLPVASHFFFGGGLDKNIFFVLKCEHCQA